MSPELLRALVDTILPGAAGLPSGSAAGVALTAEPAAPLLGAASAAAFLAATEAERVAILQEFERARPEAFRAVVTRLLSDYYETETVLMALQWPSHPPQPAGHTMPTGAEAEVVPLLDRVRARGPRWRRS